MIVCDVAMQRAWELAGKANLADWVRTELWIEPNAMADIVESSKHMTYGGERLPVDRVRKELLEGATRAAGLPGRPAKGTHCVPLSKGGNDRRLARL